MTLSLGQSVIQQGLRNEPFAFIIKVFQTLNPGEDLEESWYLKAVVYRLLCCMRGEHTRLIINLPPRHLKSMIASVAFPAWILGRDPSCKIIVVTYGQELNNELSRQFREIVTAQWYREAFPEMILAKETEAQIITTEGGGLRSTSIGASITGFGGDVIIIDDPLKVQDAFSQSARDDLDQWYRTALSTRLNNPKSGIIILAMQRLHEDDLTGRLLKQGSHWHLLKLPAIAEQEEEIPYGDNGLVYRRVPGDLLRPRDFDAKVLEDRKLEIGSLNFSAQYQQDPLPEQGNLLKPDWFPFYDDPLPPLPGDKIVMALDTAVKTGPTNDYSAAVIALKRGSDFYIRHIWRHRVEYPDLKRQVKRLCTDYQVDTLLIEDSVSGSVLAQEFNHAGIATIAIRPQGSKAERVAAQSDLMEAHQVRLARGQPWIEDFLTETRGFPAAAHDDQVDALAMLLGWARQRAASRFDYDFGSDEHQQIPSPYDLLHWRGAFR